MLSMRSVTSRLATRGLSSVAGSVVKPLAATPTRSRLDTKQQNRRLNDSSFSTVARAAIPEVYQQTEDPVIAAFQKHQDSAPRPTGAEMSRTWAALQKYATIATVDSNNNPLSTLVEFITDSSGRPVFCGSTMSPHVASLTTNGKVSISLASPGFSSLADGRVALQGTARLATDEERAALTQEFYKKFPQAFYIEFQDFRWFIMDKITSVRFNGGFGYAFKVSPEEYWAAKPDPIAAFSGPVCGHMNDDHQQDNLDMVAHYTGLADAEHVKLLAIDRLGMDTEVTRKGATFKARLPFVRPAEDRKAVKDIIVEMTRTARAARASQARQAGAADS